MNPKSTGAVTEARKSEFGELRSERLALQNEVVDLKVVVAGNHSKLLNLSETGLAFSSSLKVANKNEKVHVKLQFDEHRIVYDGPIHVAWERETSDGFTFGGRFCSHILSEALPKAIEASGQLYRDVENLRRQTEELPSEFKQFVLEFGAYLRTLKSQLDALEVKLLPLSNEVKKSFKRAIELWVSPQVVEQLQKFNMRLFNMYPLFKSPGDKENAMRLFRAEIGELMLENPFGARAQQKPLGYAGDYEMMNQIYRNEFEGRSLYAQIIHKYSINEASSRSVRYRKDLMISRFKSLLSSNKGKVIIGSLACGPAREVIEFLRTAPNEDLARCSIYLIDQDAEALLNAKRNIVQVLLERDSHCDVYYLPLSVKDFLERTIGLKQLGPIKFNLLYTVGLYDYLSQPLARALTQELLTYLNKDGHLIIGNFHPSSPTRAISEFATDWKLIYRTKEEMFDLVPPALRGGTEFSADEEEMDLFIDLPGNL